MSNLDKLQQINTNVPRETSVFEADGLIFKRPASGGGAIQQTQWVEKQKHAQRIQDYLRARGNTTYFVPHMLEVSGSKMFAIEERVPGRPLTSSFVETLTPADLDIIYRGLANFINDMATYKPIITQSEHFDFPPEDGSDKKFNFAYILNHMKKYLTNVEIDTLKKAKAYFDDLSLNDASVVFSHGDMNEHNAFYDQPTQTISVIDVADARYENANEMFFRNFARLGWLDVERLVSEFNKLPHERPINIESDRYLMALRNALQSVKWSATEILKNPKTADKLRMKMLRDEIAAVARAHSALKISRASQTVDALNQSTDIQSAAKQASQNVK